MKTTFLLLLTLFSYSQLSSQFPTIGEIYDFDVGDEFHHEIEDYNNLAVTVIRTFVLSKDFFLVQDSVIYSVKQEKYLRIFAGGEVYEEYDVDTLVQMYNNLSSVITPFDCEGENDTLWACVIDSTIVESGFCGRDRSKFSKMEGLTGFEYDRYFRDYAKGLGLIYSEFRSDSGTDSAPYQMIYYKKLEDECGTPDYSIVATKFLKDDPTVLLYPNPTTGSLKVECTDPGLREFELFSQEGKLLLAKTGIKNLETIDLSDFATGIYYLRIETTGTYILKKVVKY